ncbi:hypothetical protein Esti_003387 [Eimeria stiedai]
MKRSRRSSICPLAHGLLAEGGATVDSYLIDLCRPHLKPPSALLPVAAHGLPSPSTRTNLWFPRKFRGIHFAPHDPSLLFACCSDGALLGFDMDARAFFSEIQLSPGSRSRIGLQNSFQNVSCVHMGRYAGAPLIFTGTSGGDILIFDSRISGLTADPPALRLPAAHDGGLCGIRDGVDLRPHLFLTGGREDRWLRLFDLRFPFHYSSGDSKLANHVPYPLEATRLGPHVDGGNVRSSLMAFDVSSDGTLLAASLTHCCTPWPGLVEGEDGETILLSLRDGARTLKTIASADAYAAEFIQFSPNGKYLLQTGGVRTRRCKVCWRCACACSCESQAFQRHADVSRKSKGQREDAHASALNRGSKNSEQSFIVDAAKPNAFLEIGNSLSRHRPPTSQRCAYHRAQLLNIVQSNRTVSLKSPADGSVAFTDSFCLSYSPKRLQQVHAAGPKMDPIHSKHGPCSSWAKLKTSGTGCKGDLLSSLSFTLHGPRSAHVRRCRRRFWKYLSGFQAQAAGVPFETEGSVSSQPADWSAQRLDCQSGEEESAEADLLRDRCKSELRQRDLAGDCKASSCGKQLRPAVAGAPPENQDVGHGCLLFPLLHPQLSQFVAACGPLHPAFVRAEASTAPFTCTLWGGLVVGFGGSTATLRAGRRLYEGLKLWDSTTGVVLSWTEGYLASEADLRCIAPIPDVATGLLTTGGSLQGSPCTTGNSAQVEGLTFWSVRSRDDLLMSALSGSLALDVEPEDEDETETFSDD